MIWICYLEGLLQGLVCELVHEDMKLIGQNKLLPLIVISMSTRSSLQIFCPKPLIKHYPTAFTFFNTGLKTPSTSYIFISLKRTSTRTQPIFSRNGFFPQNLVLYRRHPDILCCSRHRGVGYDFCLHGQCLRIWGLLGKETTRLYLAYVQR